MVKNHVIVYCLSSPLTPKKNSALAELKVEAEKSVLGCSCSAKNAANLALSTTLISQQHCLQFQTQTGEMGLRSKVAQGLNLT